MDTLYLEMVVNDEKGEGGCRFVDKELAGPHATCMVYSCQGKVAEVFSNIGWDTSS